MWYTYVLSIEITFFHDDQKFVKASEAGEFLQYISMKIQLTLNDELYKSRGPLA